MKNQTNYFQIKPTTISLIVVNLLTLFFALTEHWDFATIIWIYWFQSVIIGVFNFLRIINLKKFSTKGFKVNGQPTKATTETKVHTAFFFLFHYGGFHFVYLLFLAGSAKVNTSNMLFLMLSGLAFFVNHFFSYWKNYNDDAKKIKNIGRVMFFPYARIVPMHLTIVFGFLFIGEGVGLVFFLLLKTLADVVMHQVEHV